MNIQEMKIQSFPDVSLQEWKKAAASSLKGKSLAQLHTETYEGITLKPLYLPEHLLEIAVEQFPGEPSYTRGFYKGGYWQKPWKNANKLHAQSAGELRKKLTAALQAGQDAVSFTIEEMAGMSFDEYLQMASELKLAEYPMYINTKDHFLAFAAFLIKAKQSGLQGVAGSDILSHYAQRGLLPDESALSLHFEALSAVRQASPQLKTVIIDTVPFHLAGAHAVQEIAIALAEAVFYIEWLKEEGWSPEETVRLFSFHFAVGSQFFIETSKLRAFRKLWSALCASYGVEGEAVKVSVGAETSVFTFSKHDHHVNLLRTGSESFAALLGGAEYLQVAPFDEVNGAMTALGERTARNIPLILKHEAHLSKVIDPAGGSYFIESLTHELGQMAWKQFLRIEEGGGILSALKSGMLQKELAKVMEQRTADLAVRKTSMIGTNIYADLDEELPERESCMERLHAERKIAAFRELIELTSGEESLAHLHVQSSGEAIIPVKAQRLAAPFEQLRARAASIKAQAGMICLGALKTFKPRADFVTGVLAAGGISAKLSGECQSAQEAAAFIAETGFPYYCICGGDEAYTAFGPSLIKELKRTGGQVHIDLAGKLIGEEQKKWQEAGLDGHIFAGQNLLDKLSHLLSLWEGGPVHV
ncbi:methylmalonyl-CoA mutase family protein [Bacillus xiapuensis]|uniref:methylmalonyl-CoA mutase family protein n=1 Tax=Bacillus xiapuensis TaxID=2014075 RepID=UPI000C236DB2|nr:methylmalonyl-CoA mutase family protein [Bacillus xiapuensis]